MKEYPADKKERAMVLISRKKAVSLCMVQQLFWVGKINVVFNRLIIKRCSPWRLRQFIITTNVSIGSLPNSYVRQRDITPAIYLKAHYGKLRWFKEQGMSERACTDPFPDLPAYSQIVATRKLITKTSKSWLIYNVMLMSGGHGLH